MLIYLTDSQNNNDISHRLGSGDQVITASGSSVEISIYQLVKEKEDFWVVPTLNNVKRFVIMKTAFQWKMKQDVLSHKKAESCM